MATRIVIMKDGIVEQVGAPKTVYNQPANMFVAGFIGLPAMILFVALFMAIIVTEGVKLTIPEEKLAVLKTQASLHKPIVMEQVRKKFIRTCKRKITFPPKLAWKN
ncbi:hypothetical protein ACNKHT_08520 [Shigella flexneri]